MWAAKHSHAVERTFRHCSLKQLIELKEEKEIAKLKHISENKSGSGEGKGNPEKRFQ
jgi:hypothetical protein